MANFNKGYLLIIFFFLAPIIFFLFGAYDAAVYSVLMASIWWAAGWVYDKIS